MHTFYSRQVHGVSTENDLPSEKDRPQHKNTYLRSLLAYHDQIVLGVVILDNCLIRARAQGLFSPTP